MSSNRPIVATLIVDPESEARFQRWRDRYYPAARVPAHVTLFRHLPGKDPEATAATVEAICATTPRFSIEVSAPMSLSNGVALALVADELMTLRAQIAEAFADELTRQDQRPFEPHMTVQNRVTRRRAQRTLGAVRAHFTPFTAEGRGVALWFYQAGGWEDFTTLPFDETA